MPRIKKYDFSKTRGEDTWADPEEKKAYEKETRRKRDRQKLLNNEKQNKPCMVTEEI